MVDIGGGDDDVDPEDMEEVPLGEVSGFPLSDVMTTMALCFQHSDLMAMDTKKRKSQADVALKATDDTYASLLQQDFSVDCGTTQLPQHGFGKDHATLIALQKQTIALAKNNRRPRWT